MPMQNNTVIDLLMYTKKITISLSEMDNLIFDRGHLQLWPKWSQVETQDKILT